jgi:hypothetical protein
MHGLIFKIKESHRQDQSESFVIYIKCILYTFFFHTTSQTKSLHYDQCFILQYIFVVSSRRNKTNPHHRNKFIPVLNATHLQAFKPKLSTYDQLLKTDQQVIFICVRKLKHFQPHSHLCHLWCILFAISSLCYYIWLFEKLTKQLRQTFFFIIYNFFTLLINCIETVILAEQSLHHNIILEKLDHCWVNRICTEKVKSESHTKSLLHI